MLKYYFLHLVLLVGIVNCIGVKKLLFGPS